MLTQNHIRSLTPLFGTFTCAKEIPAGLCAEAWHMKWFINEMWESMLSRMVYGQLHLQNMGHCAKVNVLRVIDGHLRVWGVNRKMHVVMEGGKCVSIPHICMPDMWYRIIDYLGKGIFIKYSITCKQVSTQGVSTWLMSAVGDNTLIWQDFPHLENSDSHHCNRLWHHPGLKTMPGPRITVIPECKSMPSMDPHKPPAWVWGCCIFSRIPTLRLLH